MKFRSKWPIFYHLVENRGEFDFTFFEEANNHEALILRKRKDKIKQGKWVLRFENKKMRFKVILSILIFI